MYIPRMHIVLQRIWESIVLVDEKQGLFIKFRRHN